MDFAELMRAELARQGLSLRAACKRMHRDSAMPSRVVNGHQPPSLGLAQDLDKLCGTTKFVKAYNASKRPRRAAKKGVDPVLRRELLRLAGASGVAMVSGVGTLTGSVSTAANDHAAVGAHLWRLYSRLETKADVLPSVAEHLSSLYEALSAGSTPQLCAIHSEALQLSGEVLYDAGHHDDAISSYLLAASAAKEAQDFDRWACALTRYALVLNAEERWNDSRELLTAAARVAVRGDSQLPTRQWVASVRAEVAAAEGDASEAERALDQAGTVLELAGPVGNGGWLRFTGDRLPEQRASAFITLGHYEQAEHELASISLSGSLTHRRRGSVLIDRARLALAQDAPEAAREHIQSAVELAARTRSGYLASKLEHLRTELEGQHGTAELQDLLRGIHE